MRRLTVVCFTTFIIAFQSSFSCWLILNLIPLVLIQFVFLPIFEQETSIIETWHQIRRYMATPLYCLNRNAYLTKSSVTSKVQFVYLSSPSLTNAFPSVPPCSWTEPEMIRISHLSPNEWQSYEACVSCVRIVWLTIPQPKQCVHYSVLTLSIQGRKFWKVDAVFGLGIRKCKANIIWWDDTIYFPSRSDVSTINEFKDQALLCTWADFFKRITIFKWNSVAFLEKWIKTHQQDW